MIENREGLYSDDYVAVDPDGLDLMFSWVLCDIVELNMIPDSMRNLLDQLVGQWVQVVELKSSAFIQGQFVKARDGKGEATVYSGMKLNSAKMDKDGTVTLVLVDTDLNIHNITAKGRISLYGALPPAGFGKVEA